MSAAAIIIIAIAATGVLMMRFRNDGWRRSTLPLLTGSPGCSQAGFRVSALSHMWVANQERSTKRQ
jgi:hypothetical protein